MESPEQNSSEAIPSSDRGADEINTEDVIDFERELGEAEEFLNHLKSRYQQIQAAKDQRTRLQDQLGQLQTEVKQITEKLVVLNDELESSLITWRDYRELLWQFLRFAGLGFVLALILKAVTG